MIEIKGKLQDLTLNIEGRQILQIQLENDFSKVYDDYKDKPLRISIKQWREKRSLDANAYFWVLCDKLAEKLNLTKEEIYKDRIKQIGGNSYISPVLEKDKDKAIEFWQSRGLGWLCEDTGTSKLEGCTNLIYYAGSSTFDTKQMARLIDGIVQDCKAVGIETMTPEELERLIKEW